MIRLKKIKSLKERVQIRKCGEVFHLLSKGGETNEKEEIFSHLLTLLSEEEKERAKYFYVKGRYDDIYFLTLDVLGESPADWDLVDDDGRIDFSKRTVFHHMLYLDSLRSPFNVGSIFRSAESFQVSGIYIAPGSASPEHPRARRTSRGTVDGVDWKEMDLADIPSSIPVFALETGGEDIATFSFPEHGICIIGSEEDGISAEARKRADASFGIVSIPQHGAKGSLNVSAAAAILLYKWQENATLR